MPYQACKNPDNYWPPEQVKAILKYAKENLGDETYLFFKLLWIHGRREGEILGTTPTRKKTYLKGKPELVNPTAKKHKLHDKKYYQNKILPGLTIADINFEECKITYRIEKKAQPELVSFATPPALILELKEYLTKTGRITNKENRVFQFCHKTAWNRFKKVIENATYTDSNGQQQKVKFGTTGINRMHNLHTLRHSFANYAQKKITFAELKYALQHSNADTTLSYIHPDESYAERLYEEML